MVTAAPAARLLSRRSAFWLVAATFGLFLFAAAAPSPLYAVYAARWHFSSAALTEVFAVYAVALLATLLLTGSLSDAIGRRPVIVTALLVQVAAMVIFILAADVRWLFAARIVQGVATGAATSALAAALVDLQPPDRPALGALVNSAAPPMGLAAGALASAAVVEYAPDPLHLVFWLMLVAFAALGAGVLLMAEPRAVTGAARSLRPKVAVERAARPTFTAVLPILIAGWAVGGFYLSLGPSLALQLAGSQNRVLGGFAIFVVAGVGSVMIVALRGWPPTRLMQIGCGALLAGLAVTVAAVGATSVWLFFAASTVTGIGFGLGWLGALRVLVALASPSGRGALIAAVYVVAYLSFALPAVVAGYLVTRVGLHTGALAYAAAVGILAVGALIGSVKASRTA